MTNLGNNQRPFFMANVTFDFTVEDEVRDYAFYFIQVDFFSQPLEGSLEQGHLQTRRRGQGVHPFEQTPVRDEFHLFQDQIYSEADEGDLIPSHDIFESFDISTSSCLAYRHVLM